MKILITKRKAYLLHSKCMAFKSLQIITSVASKKIVQHFLHSIQNYQFLFFFNEILKQVSQVKKLAGNHF